jgi:hypothetical protein
MFSQNPVRTNVAEDPFYEVWFTRPFWRRTSSRRNDVRLLHCRATRPDAGSESRSAFLVDRSARKSRGLGGGLEANRDRQPGQDARGSPHPARDGLVVRPQPGGKARDEDGFGHARIQHVVGENRFDPRAPGGEGRGYNTPWLDPRTRASLLKSSLV